MHKSFLTLSVSEYSLLVPRKCCSLALHPAPSCGNELQVNEPVTTRCGRHVCLITQKPPTAALSSVCLFIQSSFILNEQYTQQFSRYVPDEQIDYIGLTPLHIQGEVLYVQKSSTSREPQRPRSRKPVKTERRPRFCRAAAEKILIIYTSFVLIEESS